MPTRTSMCTIDWNCRVCERSHLPRPLGGYAERFRPFTDV